jgi:hypothetical protein
VGQTRARNRMMRVAVGDSRVYATQEELAGPFTAQVGVCPRNPKGQNPHGAKKVACLPSRDAPATAVEMQAESMCLTSSAEVEQHVISHR